MRKPSLTLLALLLLALATNGCGREKPAPATPQAAPAAAPSAAQPAPSTEVLADDEDGGGDEPLGDDEADDTASDDAMTKELDENPVQ